MELDIRDLWILIGQQTYQIQKLSVENEQLTRVTEDLTAKIALTEAVSS